MFSFSGQTYSLNTSKILWCQTGPYCSFLLCPLSNFLKFDQLHRKNSNIYNSKLIPLDPSWKLVS
jgi:hypothetical protein